MLSAPVSFACIFVAFVAGASDFAKDVQTAECYETVANLLEKNTNSLQRLWEKREEIGGFTGSFSGWEVNLRRVIEKRCWSREQLRF